MGEGSTAVFCTKVLPVSILKGKVNFGVIDALEGGIPSPLAA